MRRPRRNPSPEFKAKVALAAITGEMTMAEMVKKFDVHTNQLTLTSPLGNVTTLNYDVRQLSSITFPTFNQKVNYSGAISAACDWYNDGSVCSIASSFFGGLALHPGASAAITASLKAGCGLIECRNSGTGDPLGQATDEVKNALITDALDRNIGPDFEGERDKYYDAKRNRARGALHKRVLVRRGNDAALKGAFKGGVLGCIVEFADKQL